VLSFEMELSCLVQRLSIVRQRDDFGVGLCFESLRQTPDLAFGVTVVGIADDEQKARFAAAGLARLGQAG